jgi:transcriptional regulator with XRE-family HTH domain
MARTGFGLRVARWRDFAGLTQEQLGQKAGISKQYVSAIENGTRFAHNNRDLVVALADALGVETHHLNGQPYPPTNKTDFLNFTVVPLVRRALDEPDEEVQIRPMHLLDLAVDRVMVARMHCDMNTIGEHLPGLIAETRQLWFANGDPAAGMSLVKAMVTGSLAFKAVGQVDLAIRMAERGADVAAALGHPIAIAATRFTAAQCALSTGNRKRSAQLAAHAADELDRYVRTPKLSPVLRNAAYGWLVMLYLQAALAEAGLDGGDPQGRLAAADVLARQVEGNPDLMEPTPANVATWAAGIAIEAGQPDRVPDLARRVNVRELLTPQRRSRLYLDWGRALADLQDYDGATHQLLLADEAAPDDLRNRTTAVETVVYMLRHRRTGSDQLRTLAVRVGVDTDALLAGD